MSVVKELSDRRQFLVIIEVGKVAEDNLAVQRKPGVCFESGFNVFGDADMNPGRVSLPGEENMAR